MKTLHTIYSTFAKHNMAKFLTVLTMLLIVGIGQMWGAENYSWTCSGSTTFSTSGSSLNGVTWKASTSGTSQGTGVSGEKCVQIAKNTGLTLETTFFKDKNITSISIQTWGSQGNTFNLKDDNTQLASTTIPTSYTSNGAKITFSNVGTIKTKLVFNWASASKAFNVRSINITYEDATSSCSVKPTVGTSLQSVTVTENSIKATIPISSIGGCNITENGLVYSTTNSTPTVGGSGCTNVTTTACGSTAANKTVTITGLTCGQSYYIRGYATNEAGTSYTNVTTESTSDCPKYTVTLKDDNSTLTQSSAGESVTLPPRNGCVGYTFVGWTNSWSVAQTTWTTTAPTIIPAGSYTPTADESLYPVYTKSVEDDVESTLEDINISPSSFNADPLGSGNYASGKEYTATINGITLGGHYIAYNNANTPSSGTSAKAYIQMQKNNGNLYNITAFPGPITKISISQNSATADIDLYVGTEQLFASDNTQTAQTPSGDFVETKIGTSIIWEITKQEYTHFCLKKGNTGTGYISSISITYLSGGGTTTTTSYISVPDCCTQLAEVTNLKFSSITSNSITVAVPDDYSDEANASGYTFNCYSALTGGSLVATADENETSHTFTGLTKNTTYYFTVIAKGEGDYCNSVETSVRESSKTLAQYTVTLNLDGGTGTFTGWTADGDNYTMTVDAGTEITLPELSKMGYDFDGWHDGTATVTSPYIPTTDITLTAQWTPQIYTIIYKDHGDVAFSGTHESGYPTQHTYGKATTLKGATKIGYTFNGWYTNSACTGNPITQLGATDYTGDITLYAQWTEKALTNYRTDCDACIPFDGYAEINGTYHFFPGETITLTVTPPADADPADCTYQWQKKVNSDYENIEGETGLTYTKENATTSDVGHYRCVVSLEGYCDLTPKFDVKCLQLYVYYDNKLDVFNTPLNRGAEENTATISVDLQNANYTYHFKITDGCGNWYGNTGTMVRDNCTNWSMNVNEYCGLQTTKFGTYVFNVNYSDLAHLTVSVIYPAALQEAGKEIYLDNNVLNWTHSNNAEGKNKIYYRIGRSDHNSKHAMTLVPGTANLYKVTTGKYDNFEVWHIANNGCWSENNSIFKTKTGDEWAATQATAFETLPVTLDAVTVTPTTLRSVGGDVNNNNCEFYNYNITEGMKTWKAQVFEPTNGTITVSYTYHDGTEVNDFTSGTCDLAHTCLLTITATANEGYSLASLTVNDVPFTSGNTHILTDNAVIKAEFTINTHVLTWNVNGGNSLTGEYTQGSVDYGTPITPPADPTCAGHTFKGWIDQNGQTTVQTTMPDYDLTYTAQWQINQYTVTLNPNYPAGKTGTFIDKDGNTVNGNLVLTYDYNTASQTLTDLYQSIKLDGYRFDGWYTAKGALDGTVSGSKWSETKIITEDLNFYAKWTEVDCRWIETDIANINSDDEVIVAMVTPLGVYALDYSKGSSAYPPAELIEIVGNEAKFLVTSHSNSIWNISGNAIDGYILRPNGDSRNALYCTATNYNVKVGTGTDNLFTIDGGYLKNKTHNVYVGVYNSSDWRHYPANTGNAIAGQTLKFYKRVCVDALNPWYTVTFNAGSGSCDTESLTGTEDEGITLPTATPSEECQDEWTFVGWATTSVTETNTAPTLFSSGDKYYPANNCTLYAVYSKEDTNEGGDTTSKEASLSFASTDQRTSFSSTQQVWEQNGITLTNDQAASTSPVADYANPARFYANSEIIIEAPGYITQIVFDCNSESYATAMKNSIDAEASVSGDKVTLELDGTSNTYTSSISAQVRIDALTVTYLAESGPTTTTTYNSNPSCEVCDNIITISKGAEANGNTFELDKSGDFETCEEVVVVTVTPTPAEHYSVSEVTATTPTTGGTPTITNNGDGTWTVTYAQNSKGESTINVTFVEDAKATITLSELGVETTDNTTYYVGEQYTLPTTSSQSCEGKELVGWSTVEVAETDTKPTENYYELGAEVTLAETQTFYAVFATEGEGGGGEYTLVQSADDFTDGVYVIAALDNGTYYFIDGNGEAKGLGVEVNGLAASKVNNGSFSELSLPSGSVEIEFEDDGEPLDGNHYYFVSYYDETISNWKFLNDDGTKATLKWVEWYDGLTVYTYHPVFDTKTYLLSGSSAAISQNGTTKASFIRNYANGTTYNSLYFFKKTGSSATYTAYSTSCIPTYSITYDFAGGTGSHCSNTSVPQGDSYTICDEAPTKEGHTFLGWSDGINTYQPNNSFTPTSDITLTAQWQVNTYIVTWNNNGVTTPVDYNHGDALVVPTAASCDGVKEFVGWTEDNTFTYHATTPPSDIFTEKTATVTADATYYAVFATKGEGSANFVLGESGTFKMYANVNGTNYYAQGGVSSSKITSTTEAANASDYTLTHKGNNQYTIQLGNAYIGHSGSSSTDLNTTETTWTIKEGVNGSWRIVSPVNTSRALAYRASTYKIFKAYSMTSVEAGDTEYYDIEFGGTSSGYSDYTTTCQQIESIEVQNPKTEFYLTDDFTIGSGKVIATLFGGGTTDVTALATFSGYNMNVVGTYTVTVTYMGATATYDINVNPLDNAWVLTWNVSGKTNTGLGPRTVNKGSAIGTLPVPEVPAACEGKTFMGWTESNTVPSDGIGIVYITPETVPTDNTTYYAVFATVNNFSVQKPIEDITSGSKVVVVAVASLTADGGSGKAISSRTISITSQGVIGLSGDEVSISDETINTPHSTCIWTLTKEGGGIVLEQDGKYIRAVDDGYRKLLLETTKDYWKLTPVEGKYQTYHMQSGNTEHYVEWFDHTDDKYDEGEKYIGFVPYIQANDYGDFDMQFYVTLGDSADITDYTTGCEEYTITYYGFRGGYSTSSSSDGIIVLPVNSLHTVPDCGDVVKDHTDLGRKFLNLWMTQPHGGQTFKPGDTFILTQDTTLYAQWELNTTTDVTLPTGVEDLAGTDVYVYGGNTLTMVPDIVTINSLTLKGGLQPDGSYQMPNVWIPDGATLVRNTNKIYLDLAINAKNWYPFAVPFATKNDQYLDYLDPVLRDASTYGKHFAIKTYDGARRAEVGEDKANNWTQLLRHTGGTTSYLEPGVGYIISAMTKSDKDTATIRIPMTVPNTWFENGEQTVVGSTSRNTIAVIAHTGAAATEHRRHAGWNFIASPYLSEFAGNKVDNNGGTYIKGWIDIANQYNYKDTDIPYVTIPVYDFAYYEQKKVSEATLSPEWSFFVQIAESGTINFVEEGRQTVPAGIAARTQEERSVKMDIDINLTDGRNTDQMGIIVCEKYSDAYEIGRDLEKMFGSAYNLVVYSLMNDNTPLAYQAVPLLNETHAIPIGYRAPEQGEYTFSLKQNTSSIDLLNEQYEQLVLVDYEKGALTNLLNSDYTFSSERTQSNSRFALYAVPRQDSSTELPNISDEEDAIRKIFYNGLLFIIRNGNVYNGNGQIVK